MGKEPIINYMVSIDVTASKFFVYSEGGLLYNRVDYQEKVTKLYGAPIEVSNDGRNFIFQKGDEKEVIHILRLELDEFKFIKTINIFESMKSYIKNANDTASDVEEVKRAKDLRNMFENEYRGFYVSSAVKIHFKINNK